MSSDFYSSSLSRNLIRTGAFGYRENVALAILNRAENAAAERQDPRFNARSFAAFPNFSLEQDAGLREHKEFGQLRFSISAASLEGRSSTGPLPL